MVIITGYVFQTLTDLKKKLMAILLVWQKGFNREGAVERVEIEEEVRIVKWSSKFIEIKLFRIFAQGNQQHAEDYFEAT